MVLVTGCSGAGLTESEAEKACIEAVLPIAGGPPQATARSSNLTQEDNGNWYGGGTLTILDPVDGSSRIQPYACELTKVNGEWVTAIGGIDSQYAS